MLLVVDLIIVQVAAVVVEQMAVKVVVLEQLDKEITVEVVQIVELLQAAAVEVVPELVVMVRQDLVAVRVVVVVMVVVQEQVVLV